MENKVITAKRVEINPKVDEITVVTLDGMLVASISLSEGNAIVADGYEVVGFEKKEESAFA